MANVMAVTFEDYGQLHYLDCADGDYAVGDLVLYPTSGGNEVARVVWQGEEVADTVGIPVCVGFASAEDLARDGEHRIRRSEGWEAARTLIAKHGLEMKVVAVDYVVAEPEMRGHYAIYFQAPERVDFRALLFDLARTLHARIDLRQVGARDATRLTGGIGMCGRNLCCSSFLDTLEPVGIRLAKLQGLPSNPLQISGACGKLLCCLRYEHASYQEFYQKAPAAGDEVSTKDGRSGRVVGHSVPGEEVILRDKQGETIRCPLAEVGTIKLKLLRPKPRPPKETEED